MARRRRFPEAAWDPSGRRLLCTQNKLSDGRRLDQGCVVRQIRATIVARLSGVDSIAQLPLDVVPQIREQAAALLRDPKSFTFQGMGCGGDDPGQQPPYAQETHIGRYER